MLKMGMLAGGAMGILYGIAIKNGLIIGIGIVIVIGTLIVARVLENRGGKDA